MKHATHTDARAALVEIEYGTGDVFANLTILQDIAARTPETCDLDPPERAAIERLAAAARQLESALDHARTVFRLDTET